MSDESDTNDYQEAKDAIADFKAELEKVAQGLEKPMVVMIDELDRCRPRMRSSCWKSPAPLCRGQRCVCAGRQSRRTGHSVKALYGSGFDAEGYLRRFFDLDFRLPEPSREQFVQELLETTGVASILNRGRCMTSDKSQSPC